MGQFLNIYKFTLIQITKRILLGKIKVCQIGWASNWSIAIKMTEKDIEKSITLFCNIDVYFSLSNNNW